MDSELWRFLREKVTKSKINSWPTFQVRSCLHKIYTKIVAWRNCSPELEFWNKCQITVFWNPRIWGDGEIIDVLYNILNLVWDFQGSLTVGFVVNLANLYFPDPGSILSNTTITQFQLFKFFYIMLLWILSLDVVGPKTGLEIKSMDFSPHKMFMNSNTGCESTSKSI